MLREKDAIKSLPPTAGDDFKYDPGNSLGDESHGEDTDEVGIDLGELHVLVPLLELQPGC